MHCTREKARAYDSLHYPANVRAVPMAMTTSYPKNRTIAGFTVFVLYEETYCYFNAYTMGMHYVDVCDTIIVLYADQTWGN